MEVQTLYGIDGETLKENIKIGGLKCTKQQ